MSDCICGKIDRCTYGQNCQFDHRNLINYLCFDRLNKHKKPKKEGENNEKH